MGQGSGPHVLPNGFSGMQAGEAMRVSGLFGGRPLLEGEHLLRQDRQESPAPRDPGPSAASASSERDGEPLAAFKQGLFV